MSPIPKIGLALVAATFVSTAGCSSDSVPSQGAAKQGGGAGSMVAGSGGSAAGGGGAKNVTAGSGGSVPSGSAGENGPTDSGAMDSSTASREASTGESGAPEGAAKSTFSFFVTSTGSGDMGGNLGGLEGADKKCQTLAEAVGAGDRTWHAYLSLSATNGQPAVNARDRIGKGPWFNVKGDKIADNLDHLHEVNNAKNGIGPDVSLDEHGSTVPNIVNKIMPNQHDILTGTALDGTALPATPDQTCNGWTSNASSGTRAYVGHLDRTGNVKTPAENYPWNSSHYTPGCAADQLLQVGGTGRLYCFAVN